MTMYIYVYFFDQLFTFRALPLSLLVPFVLLRRKGHLLVLTIVHFLFLLKSASLCSGVFVLNCSTWDYYLIEPLYQVSQ